jgi:hypothetical protein
VVKTGIRKHPAALGRSEAIVLEKEDRLGVCYPRRAYALHMRRRELKKTFRKIRK